MAERDSAPVSRGAAASVAFERQVGGLGLAFTRCAVLLVVWTGFRGQLLAIGAGRSGWVLSGRSKEVRSLGSIPPDRQGVRGIIL